MQSMPNIHGSCGLPISVSGITHHFIISQEMADHDLRREAIKKQRSLASSVALLHQLADQDRNSEHGDIAGLLHDLACFICIAKAA